MQRQTTERPAERRGNANRKAFDDACEQMSLVAGAEPNNVVADTARDFGTKARNANVPVERMVLKLKACFTEPKDLLARATWYRQSLSVLSWALEGYYRQGDPD